MGKVLFGSFMGLQNTALLIRMQRLAGCFLKLFAHCMPPSLTRLHEDVSHVWLHEDPDAVRPQWPQKMPEQRSMCNNSVTPGLPHGLSYKVCTPGQPTFRGFARATAVIETPQGHRWLAAGRQTETDTEN